MHAQRIGFALAMLRVNQMSLFIIPTLSSPAGKHYNVIFRLIMYTLASYNPVTFCIIKMNVKKRNGKRGISGPKCARDRTPRLIAL